MKLLICPDKFKDALDAASAAAAIAEGLQQALPQAELDLAPIADGGEGTVEAMLMGGGRRVELIVTGPLGRPVASFYGVLPGKVAVIEMAAAAGLALVPPDRRDPKATTSRGVGELIDAAVREGASEIVVGIGGSATNDGGAGMAQALGAKLLDADGQEIGPGGAELLRLDSIDASECVKFPGRVKVTAACDVQTPLVGPDGASALFGPQKGATPEDVALLDAALSHYGEVIERDLGVQVACRAGAGAAGGLGAGLMAFCGATLARGLDVVSQAIDLPGRISQADFVITGEGSTDAQSLEGKVVDGISQLSARYNKPCVIVSGQLRDAEALYGRGAAAVFSISTGPQSLAEALANTRAQLTQSARAIGGLIAASAARRGQV